MLEKQREVSFQAHRAGWIGYGFPVSTLYQQIPASATSRIPGLRPSSTAFTQPLPGAIRKREGEASTGKFTGIHSRLELQMQILKGRASPRLIAVHKA